MDEPHLFQPGTHEFTGTVKIWLPDYGEIVTDSGVTVALVTQGHPPLRVGSRVTLQTRKLKPLYQIKTVIQHD